MCTRIFWTGNGQANVVARTLDTAGTSHATACWRPAGLVHHGDVDEMSWTSQYASLVICDIGGVALEGLNSQGLGAHALMDTDAVYPPVESSQVLPNTAWVGYVLDTFATVAEAVAAQRDIQIKPGTLRMETAAGWADVVPGMHLIIEDDSGDSAVFEFVDGELIVHHGHDIPVVANAPRLPEQLANLVRYRPFGGQLPPPGDITSLDRFVRANYALHYLPKPASQRQAVAYVAQAIAQAAKSPGIPYPDGTDYPTRWITVADLTHRTLYFWDRNQPSAVWFHLDQLAAEPGATELILDDDHLVGDVTSALIGEEPASAWS